jgi:imidazolonepropionase-like amidohydrolase
MRIFYICLIFISGNSLALTPKPAPDQSKSVVYHNATIHIGNGKVLNNATIAFDNGKISRIGHFRMAWQETDIDLKGKHVYPGFILPLTTLGLTEVGSVKATLDNTEVGNLNPNVRSIVAYNTDSEIIPTMKFNGVLLAQPTPAGGLVSGLSSIVQLDAWNWEDAVVSLDDAIHVNWPNSIQPKFDFSTFTMKSEKNKNYEKQLLEIKSLFNDAKFATNSDQDSNIKLAAIRPIFKHQRKLYLHASSSKSIIDSINFGQKLGIKNMVLVTGQEIEPVIDFVKYSQVPVIVNGVHLLPKYEHSSVDSGYTTAVKLHQSGILVALSYPKSSMSTMNARNLAFSAGTLVSYGLEKEQALQMITGNAAKILGIDNSYGTLEVGKSATLIITDGDALDMRGNIVEEAYIDGRKLDLDARQQELNQRYSDKYNIN